MSAERESGGEQFLSAGSVLNHYRIEHLLGEGSTGQVYRAKDLELGRTVALKVIRAGANGLLSAAVLREARHQARVDHEHICKVYESGESQGYIYIAMQHIDGQTLMEAMSEMTLTEKVRVMRDVSIGLQAAHDAGLIHRDVKPENIMAERDEQGVWRPFLTDFGLARAMGDPRETMIGVMKGSPFYMSPEQVEARNVDHRSDVYNLGASLYHVLSGETPFKGGSTVEVLMQVLDQDPDPIGEIAPDLPIDLRTITMKCLEKDLVRRYGSAREVADELDRYLNNQPVQAMPPSTAYLLKKLYRRHRTAVMACAAAVVVLVMGVAGTSIGLIRARQANKALAISEAEAKRAATHAKIINEFLEEMLSSPDPEKDGKDVKVIDIVDRAYANMETSFDVPPEIELSVLLTLARTYSSLGAYDNGRELWEKAHHLAAKNLGPEHPETLAAFRSFVLFTAGFGQTGEAGEMARDMVKTHRAVLGEYHPDTLRAVRCMGRIVYLSGRFEEALGIYRDVLQIAENHHPDNDELLNQIRLDLAKTLTRMDRPEEAEPYARLHLENLENLREEAPVDYSRGLEALALSLGGQFKHESLDTQEQVRTIREDILGPDHPSTLHAIERMGELMNSFGMYEQSYALMEPVYQKKLALHGHQHVSLIRTHAAVGMALLGLERAREAEDHFKANLDLCQYVDSLHIVHVISLGRLAEALHLQERYSEAERHFREGIELGEEGIGVEHPVVLGLKAGLAATLSAARRQAEAEQLFVSLEQDYAARNPKPPQMPRWRHDYGMHLMRSARYGEAERVFLENFDILRERPRVALEDWTRAIEDLAQLYQVWGNAPEADRYTGLLKKRGGSSPVIVGEAPP